MAVPRVGWRRIDPVRRCPDGRSKRGARGGGATGWTQRGASRRLRSSRSASRHVVVQVTAALRRGCSAPSCGLPCGDGGSTSRSWRGDLGVRCAAMAGRCVGRAPMIFRALPLVSCDQRVVSAGCAWAVHRRVFARLRPLVRLSPDHAAPGVPGNGGTGLRGDRVAAGAAVGATHRPGVVEGGHLSAVPPGRAAGAGFGLDLAMPALRNRVRAVRFAGRRGGHVIGARRLRFVQRRIMDDWP